MHILIDVTARKDLIDFFQRGERLEKPIYMPDSVSAIMAQCWEREPKVRPTFSRLESELREMLGQELQEIHNLKMKNSFTC